MLFFDLETKGLIEVPQIRKAESEDEFFTLAVSWDSDTNEYTTHYDLDYLCEQWASGVPCASYGPYDAIILFTLTGTNNPHWVDVLTMAKVLLPELDGHTLAEVGKHLGLTEKVHLEKEQFDQVSAELEHRCKVDVEILVGIYRSLLPRVDSFTRNVELPYAQLGVEYAARGIPSDYALLLYHKVELTAKLDDLLREVEQVWVPLLDNQGNPKVHTYKKPYKRNGIIYCDHCSYTQINPGSNSHWYSYLVHRAGVDPTLLERTKTGQVSPQPKVGVELPPNLREEYLQQKQQLDAVTLCLSQYHNGRVYYSLNTYGAKTGRTSTSNPNVQNLVPEIRDAVGVASPGLVNVGCDLSNIELRLIAETVYRLTGDDSLIRPFEQGLDCHEENRKKWGLESRAQAKVIFPLCYGAGVRKVALFIQGSEDKAREILDSIRNNFPAFFTAKENVVRYCEENGYIRTLGGRKVFYSGDRTTTQAFNCVIQGGASDLFKALQVRLYHRGWVPYVPVHDELQIEMEESQVEQYLADWREVLQELRVLFRLRVPLSFDHKVGINWQQTH